MTAPVKPKKVQAFGKDSYWLVPAIANINAPTDDEINASTGINLSCTLIRDYEGFDFDPSKVTLPGALCETEDYEGQGTIKWTASDIEGYLDPQGAAAGTDKKAFEFVKAGFVGFLVRRQAKKADVSSPDVVKDEFVDVAPVSISRAITKKSNTGEDGLYTFRAGVAITGSPAINVKVVEAP